MCIRDRFYPPYDCGTYFLTYIISEFLKISKAVSYTHLLPNVGKSTLFNSLTKAGALSANYPFATIDPNVGIVSVLSLIHI